MNARTVISFAYGMAVTLFLVAWTVAYQQAGDFANRDHVAQVLLLGDSICMGHYGYAPHVQQTFHGVANIVTTGDENGKHSRNWLANLDRWLGDRQWDVIHFNCGLHDQRFIDGVQGVPLEEYEANLRQIVQRLKRTGATLIWGATTYVPLPHTKHKSGEHAKYRAVAHQVMMSEGVRVNDLLRAPKLLPPGDVHFRDNGSRMLGVMVSDAIFGALQERNAFPE